MKLISILIVLAIFSPVIVHSSSFEEEGIETHIGAGGALFAPFHFRKFSFGYSLSLTMRPSYARYLYDELERWNLGMTLQSQFQYISDQYSFKDICLTVRYYCITSKCSVNSRMNFIHQKIKTMLIHFNFYCIFTVYW